MRRNPQAKEQRQSSREEKKSLERITLDTRLENFV